MDIKLYICIYLMMIGFVIIDHVKQHNYIMWKTQDLRREIESLVLEVIKDLQ